jgi:fibronectin-binding autotransporter adhesin
MRLRPFITCLLTLATLATTAAAAQACDETWNNASGGSWTTPTNWTPNGVPAGGQAVCITLPGTYTVTLSASGGANIASLTLGASSGTQTLDVQGQDYNYQGEFYNSTTLTLNGPSTIGSSGELVLDATSGGPAPGAGNLAGGSAILDTDTLTNAGKIITQSDDPAWQEYFEGELTDTASASLDVNSGKLTMPSPNGGGIAPSYAYSVTNSGSMTVAPSATLVLAAGLGDAGDFVNNGPVTNSGSITGVNQGGQMTWTQSGGSESGNPVVLEAGAWLVDSVGTGSFLFNYESGALSGTIPIGQTVTVQGEVFNSGGEDYNSTSLALNANGSTAAVTNNGTLALDAPGSGSASGGNTSLTNGTLDNNGTVTAQVEDSSWGNALQANIVNGSSGKIDVNSGTLTSNGSVTTSNSGVVTVAPGALWSLNEAGTLINEAGGTIVPEIANATSYGSFQLTSPCCNGPGAITAGGTLAPKLVGGFTPAANEEFPIVALDGGKFTGTFGSVGSGFAADYKKETASPAFVGVVYGQSAAAKPTLSVGAISGGGTKLSVRLSCGNGGKCSGVKIVGTVKERLKSGKVKAVTANARSAKRAKTKVVVVASATTTLAAGANKTVSIKLNATGRKLLIRFRKLTVLTTVRSGGKTVKTVKVVFHASRKR